MTAQSVKHETAQNVHNYSALDNYSQILQAHVLPILGHLRIDKIQPVHIEDVLISMSVKGLSKRTRSYALWLTKAPLQAAVARDQLRRNPAADINVGYKQKKTPKVTWNSDEVQRFLKAAKGERLYAVFYLLLSLGLRRGEALGLQWSTLHLDQDYLTIARALRRKPGGGLEFATPKTESSARTIYLARDVIEVLKHHRAKQDEERTLAAEAWEEAGIVFPTEVGTPYDPDNLKRVMKRICDRANVPVMTIHGTRHTYASLALKQRVDDKVLSERLGHTDVKFTRSVYQHTYEEQHRAAALSMSELLGGTQTRS